MRVLFTVQASVCVCVCFQTALHWAAKQGRQEAVDMMLRFGADVNARSVSGVCVCVYVRVTSAGLSLHKQAQTTSPTVNAVEDLERHAHLLSHPE